MNFQFTHPGWLLLLPFAVGWVIWLSRKTYVQIGPWRRWGALGLRLIITLALILAIAGLQWKRPLAGMNVYFLVDRSDSVPSAQQEQARVWINHTAAKMKPHDRAGIILFGGDASIETTPSPKLDQEKFLAVVGTKQTDIGAAIRLGTAAFPENGQKRLVLLSDGNETMGNALGAVRAARALGVTIDVVPMGIARPGDVRVEKLGLPTTLKKGQTFDVKIFVQSDRARTASLRLFRNDQFLGQQKVDLNAGKNLFTFPQTLTDPGFYSYDVQLDAPDDPVPQNNRASGFVTVRGNPRILIVSSDPTEDRPLYNALRNSRLDVQLTDINGFPTTLAQMQSYDAIFLSNVSAGDLGTTLMNLLESAVRDFGVGLVCVGGDQTYAAGGYRGTPLETTLPVDMELNSKKVLPSGAVVLIMHGMEFNNGNQIARECALGVLDALGPQDQLGVVLWDGRERWLFPLSKVGNKQKMGHEIAGMNQGDLPSFQHVMQMAYSGTKGVSPGLKQAHANLKHIIVFSDGDPAPPTPQLMQQIVADRITVSTVLIAGHSGPATMIRMAQEGHGRFYDVRNPSRLPQIFLKETMVVLKSAIFEQPFKPRVAASSEILRGINAAELPILRGYVCTTPKARAEVPLVTDKGDPLLAQWQYGLGRAVAFTSDAKAKWARDWLTWDKYRQFWSQVAQWSLRRLDNADFVTQVSLAKGQGVVSVEALDAQGNYRNFLNLRAAVVGPKGGHQTIRFEQTGPGRYEAHFPTREVGSYLLNLEEMQGNRVRAAQAVGASVNYSPEYNTSRPNRNLLSRIAKEGGGKLLPPLDSPQPGVNPFLHNRQLTFQPRDLWPWLLELAVLLFVADVGVRRIDIDRSEWLRATRTLRRWVFFWHRPPQVTEADESLGALLARRDTVRSQRLAPTVETKPSLFQPKEPSAAPELPGQPAPKTTAPSPSASAPTEPAKPAEPQSTTSRLLDAKRRASRKLGK